MQQAVYFNFMYHMIIESCRVSQNPKSLTGLKRTHQNFLGLPIRNGEHGILQGCADTVLIIQYLKVLISSHFPSKTFELYLRIYPEAGDFAVSNWPVQLGVNADELQCSSGSISPDSCLR